MSKPVRRGVTFTAKIEFDHGPVLDLSRHLTYAQAEVLWSIIQAVLAPVALVPDDFKEASA